MSNPEKQALKDEKAAAVEAEAKEAGTEQSIAGVGKDILKGAIKGAVTGAIQGAVTGAIEGAMAEAKHAAETAQKNADNQKAKSDE